MLASNAQPSSDYGWRDARGVNDGALELAEAFEVVVDGGCGRHNGLCRGLFGGVSRGMLMLALMTVVAVVVTMALAFNP